MSTVVYTDGSHRTTIGWAWCCGNHFGYGTSFASDAVHEKNGHLSNVAELHAVLEGIRAANTTDVLIVNDCPAIVQHINSPDYYKTFTPKRAKKAPMTLLEQLSVMVKDYKVKATLPFIKDRGRHGWCHRTAAKFSTTNQILAEFDKWWKANSKTIVNNDTPPEDYLELKQSAANRWLISRIRKPVPPPLESPDEISILDLDGSPYVPMIYVG